MPLKYLIQDKDDFDSLIEYITDIDIFGIDTETNGFFSRFKLSLVGISIGVDDFACYIPLTHYEGRQLPMEYVLGKFKPLLENPSTNYVGHNIKFDEKVFKVYDINCNGSGDDTYVLNWLLKEDAARGTRGLKPLVKEHCGVQMETYEDVINKSPKARGVDRDYNFAKVPIEDALSYAADDAYFTLSLYRQFAERAQQEGLWEAYTNIERPLLRVVRDMEWRGVGVDREYLKHASIRYPKIMEEIEEAVYSEAGQAFNVDSGQQLGRVLFNDLNIDNDPPKTATGQYKTDKKTLEKYQRHPIVKNILRRKKIKKTYDVFVEGLIPHLDNDDRVHADFNSTGTVTGRFSSSKPNLQQLQGDEIEEIRVRDFFIPSPGYTFVVGDFGQIELRVMAHGAKDEIAIAAFNSGKDFHTETARVMFDVPSWEEPTNRQRFYAKGLNFGIPYGRGAPSVGEALGVSIHQAEEYISQWFEAFPRVNPYRETMIARARQTGYVRTLSGRKRRLPDLCSKNFPVRMGAERQCFNTYCQGSAADIIKLVMVQVIPKLVPLDAHILIQIHDELVLETPVANAQETVEVLRQTAENPLNGRNPLIVPLKFEPKIVNHWSEAK